MVVSKNENVSKKKKFGWTLVLLILAVISIWFVVWNPSGCIELGDTVTISYSASLEDGTLIEEYTEDMPMVFVVGEWSVRILDEAIIDMKKGGSKTIGVSPEDWYGDRYNPNKVQDIPLLMLKQFEVIPEVGKYIEFGDIQWVIKELKGAGDAQMVVIDTNPVYTWQNLEYKFKVLNVTKVGK